MLAYYGAQISPHMTDTPEGYLICRDVPIARTGEMVYQASELGLDGPDRLVTVYRDPADVFHPDALASFEGKDITAGHPAESVGPANHSAYSRGHIQNVRRAGEFVIADLLVKDASLISDVKNGVVREISCGYNCVYTSLPDGRFSFTYPWDININTGASGKTEWAKKTPDEILADVNAALTANWAAADYDPTALPNHILIPYTDEARSERAWSPFAFTENLIRFIYLNCLRRCPPGAAVSRRHGLRPQLARLQADIDAMYVAQAAI